MKRKNKKNKRNVEEKCKERIKETKDYKRRPNETFIMVIMAETVKSFITMSLILIMTSCACFYCLFVF